MGKRLGDPSLERVDVQLQAIGISQQALESLGGGLGGRGAISGARPPGVSPSSMSATCAVSRTVSRSRSATWRGWRSSRRPARAAAIDGTVASSGRDLDSERIGVAVAQAQQPVLYVVVEVVALGPFRPAFLEEVEVVLDVGEPLPREADSRWLTTLSGSSGPRRRASRSRRHRSTSSSELRKAGSKPPARSKAARRTSMHAAVTAWNARDFWTAGWSAGKPA